MFKEMPVCADRMRQNDRVRKTEGEREMEGVGGGEGKGKGRERDKRQKTETDGERGKTSKRRQKKSPEGHMTLFSQKLLGCSSHCNYSNKCTLVSLAALQIRHNCISKFGA